MHIGLNLSTDFQGTSAFNLNVDHRMTWLTERGLEWRNRFYLGDLTGIASELYQPLDLARKWFTSSRLVGVQELETIFLDDEAVAQYRNRRGEVALDLGHRFGTYGEARFGYRFGKVSFTKSTGSAALTDSHDNLGAAYLRVVLDQYNNWNFPSSGFLAVLDLSSTRPSLGADVEYYSGAARLEKAFGTDNNHFRIGFDYYTTFNGERPIYNAFALGGFQTCPATASANSWSTVRCSVAWCMSVACSRCLPSARAFIGEARSRRRASRIASMAPIQVA